MSGTPAPAARTRPLTRLIDELEASDPADPAQAQAQAQEAIDEAIVVNQFIDTQLPGQQCALTRRVCDVPMGADSERTWRMSWPSDAHHKLELGYRF